MRIYVVRHGDAEPAAVGEADAGRRLTVKGRRQAARVGAVELLPPQPEKDRGVGDFGLQRVDAGGKRGGPVRLRVRGVAQRGVAGQAGHALV